MRMLLWIVPLLVGLGASSATAQSAGLGEVLVSAGAVQSPQILQLSGIGAPDDLTPHGIKVQGQTFLQAADWNTAITVRNAAHEMLHPPVDMDGPAALAALEALGRDALLARIVAEHDPRWGYTTLPGLLSRRMAELIPPATSSRSGSAR